MQGLIPQIPDIGTYAGFSQQQQYFCFLLIKESYSVYLAYVYCPIILLFSIFAIRQIVRLKRRNQFPMLVKIIYALLMVWSLACISQIIFSYYLYKKTVGNADVDDYLSQMSRSVFVLVFVAIFTLQTAVILTPYQWMKSLIQFYAIRLSTQLKQTIISEASDFIFPPKVNIIQKRCKRMIEIYLIARSILLVGWVLYLSVIYESHNVNNYRWLTQITLIFVLLESAITLAILLVGIHAIRKNQMLKQLVDEQQIKYMLHRYYFLIGATLFRIIGFAIRTFAPIQSIRLNVIQSHCTVHAEGHILAFWILAMQALLMDFIPFFTMLKIFRVEEDSEETEVEENAVYLSNN